MSLRRPSITLWKIPGAEAIPNGSPLYRKSPLCVLMTTYCLLSSLSVNRKYAWLISSFVNFSPPARVATKKYVNLASIFLASLALKMKLFLQDLKTLIRILQKIAKSYSCKILTKSCKKIILQFFLARFLQDFYILQEKLHF